MDWNFLWIAFILVAAELIYFRIADHFNIIDRPNLRSSHKSITLRGGGIIFPIAVWVFAAFYGVPYLWFMLGMTLISAVSFWDDVRSVPNKVRIVVQFAAMLMMFYDVEIFSSGLWWLAFPGWIVCTGIINAYNFMDGINGITGGYSIVVLLSLLLANQQIGFAHDEFIYVMLLSLLVFCFFNFRRKAKCFAGDVGAVSMAFVILFLLGRLMIKTGDVGYIAFLAVYGVDSVLTIVHRLMLRENIFQAHRKHAYQIMANELKMPHISVSLIYMFLQAAISLGAIWLPVNRLLYFIAVSLLLSLVYVWFMRRYYHLHREYLAGRR